MNNFICYPVICAHLQEQHSEEKVATIGTGTKRAVDSTDGPASKKAHIDNDEGENRDGKREKDMRMGHFNKKERNFGKIFCCKIQKINLYEI